MREIKYRCWDKEGKRWLNPNEIVNDWGGTPWIDAMCVAGDTFELRDSAGQLDWLQFTGLLDKNDKPIYEGDVVIPGSMTGQKHPEYYAKVVGWITANARWNISQSRGIKHLIIGNLYETPELLKGEL